MCNRKLKICIIIHQYYINIQTKQFCGFVVIVVVIGDGTGSFKTVNLEVFKLKKEKLFFLISITWYTDTLIPEVSYEPDFVGTRNLNLEIL